MERHLKLQLTDGVTSKWPNPGWWEEALSVWPGAPQSTSLPSLGLHLPVTVSHTLFIIWVGGHWHQSVECEPKLKINESLKRAMESKFTCGEKNYLNICTISISSISKRKGHLTRINRRNCIPPQIWGKRENVAASVEISWSLEWELL